MPTPSADFAAQSDPDCNRHFSRRWSEPAWLPAVGTSRLGSHRVRPIDVLIQHSADASRHVLTGRALEGRR